MMLWFAIASRVAIASSEVDYWFCITVAISISTVLLVSLEKVKLNLFVLESSSPRVSVPSFLASSCPPGSPPLNVLNQPNVLTQLIVFTKQKIE